jgi:hypothetical protein
VDIPIRAFDRLGNLTELFNMAVDPYEEQNLVAQQPDKVKDLRARDNKLAAQAAPPKLRPKPADFKSPKVWGEQ